MTKLIQYIKDILGIGIEVNLLAKAMTDKLPMYLSEGYQCHKAVLATKSCILAEIKAPNTFSIAQIEKHFEQIKNLIGLPVIAVFNTLETYNRKRLIEKKIAFIVPDKQLYIPEFLIDLNEHGIKTKKESPKLSPTAQELLLFHISNTKKDKSIENHSFKYLASLLHSNAMGITRAVESLKYFDFVEVSGEKEKSIHFLLKKHELWNDAIHRNLFINPVLKRVFVDEKPDGLFMLKSNTSALPEYTDMSPSRQLFYAIEKNIFYELQKKNALINANESEGKYCLEVWKYNPEILVDNLNNNNAVVDPLSLYLSLKDSQDERIEMALEQLIEGIIW